MFQSLKAILAFGVTLSIAFATAAAEGEYYQGASSNDASTAHSETISSRDRTYFFPAGNKGKEASARVNNGDYWEGATRPN